MIKIKKAISGLYFILIPLLIVGITFGFTTFPISLIALVSLLFITNRHTIGFFFVMYGASLAGIIRTMYPVIPIYGVLLEVIGFLLMWDLLIDFLKEKLQSVLLLGLTLAIFGVFFIIGPMDDFSKDKYFSICYHGIFFILGYYVLDHSKKLDVENLTRMLLLGSICMYSFVISYYSFSPGSLTDYNWFRDQMAIRWYESGNEHTIVSYQHIGMMILYGIAIYFSQTEIRPRRLLFYLFCAVQLVLMSGCRQAMLGLFIVVVLRMVVFNTRNIKNKNIFRKFVGYSIGFTIAYFAFIYVVQNLSSEIIRNTLEAGDAGRERLLLQAWQIFQSHLLIGSGIGGFHAITGEVWPHNFFLELLCETGLLGTIALFTIVVVDLVSKHVSLLHITRSNMFYFLVLSALFIRVMVSSDLPESIGLFSAVFAVSATKKGGQKSSIKGVRKAPIAKTS